jgi:uncharacterized C2H2 Zn-finger protein
MAGAAAISDVLHSCEICGQEGLGEEALREHVDSAHVAGALQCPFCDLRDVTAAEMTLHVNSVHLDYLTPESEDKSFLEEADFHQDVGQMWQLERRAKEGLTSGVDKSPMTAESPMSTSAETSEVNSRQDCNGGAIQKRPRLISPPLQPQRSRAHMSLDVRSDKDEEVCPLCPHRESDPSKLQEHVNRCHFDLTSPADASTSEKFVCPMCSLVASSLIEMERHMDQVHSDILSPQKPTAADDNSNGNIFGECPVCGQTGIQNANVLARHVEAHFVDDSRDYLLAQELERKERERRKFQEERELARLRTEYGMDGEGNFRQQATAGMERAVFRGNMSVTDYHERRVRVQKHYPCVSTFSFKQL